MFKAILSEQRHHLEKSLFHYRALKYAGEEDKYHFIIFCVMSRVIFHSCDSKAEVGLDQSHVIDKVRRFQIETKPLKP
jgi:hypothetical protein